MLAAVIAPVRIALLIETSNVYGRELLRGIHAWSREFADWSFRLVEQGRGAVVPGWLSGWEGDGVIARVENERIGQALLELGLPVVDVSAALERAIFPQVLTDSAKAVALAIGHFEELGFREFAFCGDRSFHWSRERERHFAALVAEKGVACHVRPLRIARPEAEIERLAAWLQALPKPVGVLACYDIRGQEVLEACRLAGLRVPEEVAVLGVHNDEILCELCDPPLSSVIPNARSAGYEAAALLSRMLRGEPSPVEARYIAPVGVAKRQSTDVVAIADRKIAAAVSFIQERACLGISVQDVLKAVPMARTQLERQFRRLVGRSPREQIERVRLAKVKEMLWRTNLPVAAIAESAGFEYPEYLTVAFKRVYGVTPRAYRAQARR